MMIRFLVTWFLCSTLGVAAEVRKAVAFAELPPAVQMMIQKVAGTGKAGAIERVEEDGEVSYEAEITTDGRKRDITVGADGNLQHLEVTLEETPAAVQKTVSALVGAGRIVTIDKIIDDGEATYDVAIKTTTGQDRVFTVEENGTVTSVEVAFAETPAAVQKTVRTQLGAGKLVSIY